MTVNKEIILTASGVYHDERTDKALALMLKSAASRGTVQQCIQDGTVFVIDESGERKRVAGPRDKIIGGAEYAITLPAPALSKMEQPAEALHLDILYEDEHLLLVNKPAGMTVHPGAGTGNDTLAHALKAAYGDTLPGDPERPGIVHRLDRETSGVMVVAKTEEARLGLVEMISERAMTRLYHAVCQKTPVPPAGVIEAPMARHPSKRKEMHVPKRGAEGPQIKHARTRYRNLSALFDGFYTLVECKLDTGRTHQIRVHMAHIGHPVAGDHVYNKYQIPVKLPDVSIAMIKSLTGQALHARTLGFTHPVTGEDIFAEAPYPNVFAALLKAGGMKVL